MDVALEGVRVERGGRLVLDVPTLRIRGGCITAILGPNGSGKTTLLRSIAGLEPLRTGTIRLLPQPKVPRHAVAFVFQEQVMLRRSVRENLELGLRLRGVNGPDRTARVLEAARLLGIEDLLTRRADRLSGGEGRRVSLARALSLQAPLVLLDEPLAGLDDHAYRRLLGELPRLLVHFQATTLLVTHDRDEALRLADDLVVIVNGRVCAAGDKRSVCTNVQAMELAEVLGHAVVLDGGTPIAVPPGALRLGDGLRSFPMVVERVVDLVDRRELAGRIGGVLVHVPLLPADSAPAPGDHVRVAADRSSVLTS